MGDDHDETGVREGGGPARHDPAAFTRTTAVAFEASVDDPAALREAVAERRPSADVDTAWLVDVPSVATATLFAADAEDRLRLYLERPDDRDVAAPKGRLQEGSVLPAAPVTPIGEDLVQVAGPEDLLFHMHNPARPGAPPDPDVVTVALPVASGWRSRILRRLPGVRRGLGGTWPANRLARSSARVLAEERMWTESIWVENGGTTLRWYMEAADLEAVVDTVEVDETWFTRVASAAAERIAGTSFEALSAPGAASEWRVLAHATSPERP